MSSDLPDGYELSTDPARLDVDQLHEWLSVDAYWALGRSREAMETAIARSLNFGVYDTGSGALVGYARVITDRATFGWLCDVYIARPVRGEGLGTALTNAVCAYLEPFGLRRVLLATADAQEIYARAGFEPLANPGKWMVLGDE
jgi:predicted GNAT family acetyltransferase